jgi:YD repeat-containing protein
VTLTNQAFGLRWRAIEAAGLSDAATNDFFYGPNGFLSETIAYTGTSDPNITNYYVFNEAGQLIQETDAAGRSTAFTYDGMGRLESKQVFDAGGQIPVYSQFRYYDGNGNLTWVDGPRSNPAGYVWADYDGANRKIQEIHWRSQAQTNGLGVEAATGDDLYATTFNQYDGFGNLLTVSDQLGDWMSMAYDADGQLIARYTYAPNHAAALTTEGFAYWPGGDVQLYTNVLFGVTSNYYTTTGKLSQRVNPDGSTNRWTFYLDGRTNRIYLANSNYWQLT